MVLLAYASSASSYAFSTASSYVFRPDASTSSPLPPTSTSIQPLKQGHARTPSTLPSPGPTSTFNWNGNATGGSANREGEEMCDLINLEEDLYKILGVGKKAKQEEIRRAFLGRSRVCHPDKLPEYPSSTPAFQRLSYAYETLSKPGSRRLYDLGGGRRWDAGVPREGGIGADETLNGVLRAVFLEFLAGDFETIRAFVTALNEGNPGLNLGDEAVDNLEGVFRRIREILLTGQKYLRLIKFELIRLFEIQHSLRSLGYLDFIGRLRLTLALTRVTLEIPMVLDRAMREEVSSPRPERRRTDSEDSTGTATGADAHGELERRGLLGTKVRGVLVLACKVLEKGERFGM